MPVAGRHQSSTRRRTPPRAEDELRRIDADLEEGVSQDDVLRQRHGLGTVEPCDDGRPRAGAEPGRRKGGGRRSVGEWPHLFSLATGDVLGTSSSRAEAERSEARPWDPCLSVDRAPLFRKRGAHHPQPRNSSSQFGWVFSISSIYPLPFPALQRFFFRAGWRRGCRNAPRTKTSRRTPYWLVKARARALPCVRGYGGRASLVTPM